MNNLDELKHLFAAKTKCIWIKTHEEVRVIEKIKEYILKNALPYDVKSWSMYSGLKDEPLLKTDKKIENDKSLASIDRLIALIDEKQLDSDSKPCIYILKDFHLMVESKQVIRGIRDLKEKSLKDFKSYQPIIVVSPVINIPIEYDKLFTIINFDTPSKEDISSLITSFVKKIKLNTSTNNYIIPTEEEVQKSINLALGLTHNEILSLLAKSLSKYKTLNSQIFYEARLNLINKTGLLELINSNITINDMGGNHNFKNWINDIKISMTKEAEEFGVEKSKGFLAIGLPGSSKTLSAEMLSNELNLPLLKFNINKIMNSFVGKSEQNMETTLNIVKACSPCILLIDEIEKTLAGIHSSSRTDGGTMARVIGSLLQFLSSNDSKDVFTIMTSNDISQMPPELTRSGRLDTIWYFGMPIEEERKEIWKIHFNKTPIPISDELLDFASSNSEHLTGAEIKEAVKITIRKAYIRYLNDNIKSIQKEDIISAINEIIPIYNSSKEKILSLERYAKNRARFATNQPIIKQYAPLISMHDIKN